MHRILLAFDGSAGARRALSTTAELACALAAPVSVLPMARAEGRGAMRGAAVESLDEARAFLRERGIDAAILAPTGDPTATIVRLADDGEYDLIVVGSRGLAAFQRQVVEDRTTRTGHPA